MNCGVPTETGMSARKHGSNHIITCSPRCEDCEDCFGSIDFWCPTKVNSDDWGMHCPSKGPIALVKDPMRHWDFMKLKDLGTLNDVAYTAPTCTGGGGDCRAVPLI